MQVVHSHWSGLDRRQSRVRKQRDDVCNINMPVPVKMRQQPLLSPASEVDR